MHPGMQDDRQLPRLEKTRQPNDEGETEMERGTILGQIGEFVRTESTTRTRVQTLAEAIETAAIKAIDTIVDAGATRLEGHGRIGCSRGEAEIEIHLNPRWTKREEVEENERVRESAKAAGEAVELHTKAQGQAPYRADVIVRLDTKPVHVESIAVAGTADGYTTAVVTAKHWSVGEIANDEDHGAGTATERWAAKAIRDRDLAELPELGVEITADTLVKRWGTTLLRHARP